MKAEYITARIKSLIEAKHNANTNYINEQIKLNEKRAQEHQSINQSLNYLYNDFYLIAEKILKQKYPKLVIDADEYYQNQARTLINEEGLYIAVISGQTPFNQLITWEEIENEYNTRTIIP